MKVKHLIECLSTCNQDAELQIDFTHTNYNTCIVPNNVKYEGKDGITIIVDTDKVILWGGD